MSPPYDEALLGRILARMGLLNQKQREQALAVQAQLNRPLGEILLQLNLITPQDLDAALRIQEVLLAGRSAERYSVEEEIGRGGMATVLNARDRVLRRPVAMKVLPEGDAESDLLSRFIEEAQVTSQLEHPNIVPIHDLGLDAQGRIYFTMKLVQGRSLAEIIETRPITKERPLQPSALADLVDIFLKVCDGVAFAHSKGVIHRDLKPENIMVGKYGEVLVLDWGLASLRGRKQRRSQAGRPAGPAEGLQAPKRNPISSLRKENDVSRTLDGRIVGTAQYMSPEQALGQAEEIDERSDVFSLGLILYELLTGRQAFEEQPLPVLLADVIKRDPPPPRTVNPRIDPDLEKIALKCMEKEKGRRYPNAGELAQDLRRFVAGEMIAARPARLAYRTATFLKRHRRSAAAVLVAFAAILAFGGFGLKRYYDAWVGWELLYQDDFESEALATAWIQKSGRWQVVEGELEAMAGIRTDACLLLDLPAVGDVRLDFEARCVPDDPARVLEAAAFCNASLKRLDADGYFASFGSTDGVKLQRQGSNVVFNRQLKPEAGRRYRLRLERIGERLTFYVDGSEAVSYRDPLPASGGEERNLVGLYLWDSQTRFDNLRLWGRGSALTISVLEKGNVLFERGHYEQAAEVYANITRTRPGTDEALEASYRGASCWLERAKVEAKNAGWVWKATPGMEKNLAKARPLLERIQAEGRSPWWQFAQAARAESEFLRGNFDQAVAIAIRGAEGDRILREAIRHLLGQHRKLFELEYYDAAATCLEALRKLYPDDEGLVAEAASAQATLLEARGRFDEALAVYDRILSQSTTKPSHSTSALSGKTNLLRMKERYEDAFQATAQVLRDLPDQRYLCAHALTEDVRTLRAQERFEETLSACDRVLTLYGDQTERCAWALEEKGNALRSLGRFQEALALYREVPARFAKHRYHCAWSLRDTAETLHLQGRDEEALVILEDLQKEYADQKSVCARALCDRGEIFRLRARMDEALASYERVLGKFASNRPLCAQALLRMGEIQRGLKEYSKALALCDRVLLEYPDRKDSCAEALFCKGTALRALGRLNEALAAYEQVVRVYGIQKKSFHYSLRALAETHLLRGDRGAVLAALQRNLSFKKDDSFLRAALNPQEGAAVAEAERRAARDSRNQYDLVLALCAYAAGDDRKACRHLLDCLEHTPESAKAGSPAQEARELLQALEKSTAKE